jgi:hypothetical protein
MSSAFGSGPSNGQFWFGGSTFPGFLYKKNLGVGGRRSTKMNPGGNITCNSPTYLYNKYTPGGSGVGASSMSNRRAKNRHATVCRSGDGNNTANCFPCQPTLGQYSNYTHNPNGYYPCITLPTFTPVCASLVEGNIPANMNTAGMLPLIFTDNDDGYAYLPFTGMDFYFFGTNYGNSNGTNPTQSIYMSTNYAFGFGIDDTSFSNWTVSNPAILFDFFDSYNFASYVSPPQKLSLTGLKYVRIVATGTDFNNSTNPTIKKAYEIYYVRDTCFQYMQFNCNVESVDRTQYDNYSGNIANISNITDGIAFQNTFGAFGAQPPNTGGPQTGGSYVIRSDLNGNNWQFFPNTHLIF